MARDAALAEQSKIETADQFVDITVYTQTREENQWGMFDFEMSRFDRQTKRLLGSDDFDDDLYKQSKALKNEELQQALLIGRIMKTSY